MLIFLHTAVAILTLSSPVFASTATCPLMMPFSGQTVEMTVEEYLKRYVGAEGERTLSTAFSPMSMVDLFLKGGCEDDSFLESIVDGHANHALHIIKSHDIMPKNMYGRYGKEQYNIRSIRPSKVDDSVITNLLDLYFLGRPKPFDALVEKMEEAAASGDVWANTALAVLGGAPKEFSRSRHYSLEWYFDNFLLSWGGSKVLERYAVSSAINMAGFGTRFGRGEKAGVNLAIMSEELNHHGSTRLEFAVSKNFVPAIIRYISGSTHSFYVCDVVDIELYRDRILEFPDVVLDASKRWVEEVIRSRLSDRQISLQMVETVAVSLANIASDCDYSVWPERPAFSINDQDYAEELVRLALSVQINQGFSAFTAWAGARLVDRRADIPEAHSVAARLLLRGAGGGLAGIPVQFHENFLPKFSNQTIVEAQKILEGYGYFHEVIDGNLGPEFHNAIDDFHFNCLSRAKDYPSVCLPESAWALRQRWLGPFLTP